MLKVIYGTEENAYEIEEIDFESSKSAKDFANDIVKETQEDGYDVYVEVVTSEDGRENAIAKLEDLRRNQIAVTLFGCDYDELEEEEQEEVDSQV